MTRRNATPRSTGSGTGGGRVLRTLNAFEQAAVLADLLAAHPELADEAERLATERLECPDRAAVAGEVEEALTSLTVEDVWERGRAEPGFVHEHEAAWMAGEEVVQPFLDDMRRAASLGLDATARATGWGILLGLYAYRNLDEDSGLGRAPAPDFAADHARHVLQVLGAGLPHEELARELPEWAWLLPAG